jgi:hypothetical protein
MDNAPVQFQAIERNESWSRSFHQIAPGGNSLVILIWNNIELVLIAVIACNAKKVLMTFYNQRFKFPSLIYCYTSQTYSNPKVLDPKGMCVHGNPRNIDGWFF